MITFKCKMCGGDLTFEPGASVAECPYCGTNQTLPKLDDDKRANLYDRANHFRRQNEFDKAMAIYEQVLAEDRTDAEAYWSLVLCRYGIEYVEDPASHKRVPTVNRVQYASILADEDYKSALAHADAAQRRVYEAEANAIAEIQKGILDISRKEAPFDVFICYKETDSNGRRTPDSVLANDMYHQLTKEGFKVFFSRITLEDKIGTAYEPYIFAALNSAKVMVVLGTKPEYFNAVWVKNEWSRYLALIRGGADKTLVPAYRDMDPYDLPEEFAHLQAQDMGKLGFMQDLIRGIKKILQKDEPKSQTVIQQTVAPANNAAPLVKRAFMSLEDGDFAKADDFCEQALNLDPENARAWLGKLMAELKVRRESDLKNQAQTFDGNGNYQKALRFGDEALKAQLKADIEFITKRNEHARQKGIFDQAGEALQKAKTVDQCLDAMKQLKTIPGFNGVKERIADCNAKIESINAANYQKATERQAAGKWQQAIGGYNALKDYRDSRERIAECEEGIRTDAYRSAEALRNDQKWDEAISAFEKLGDYRDSRQQAQMCRDAKAEQQRAEEARREQERREAEAKEKAEAAKRRARTIVAILLVAVIAAGAFLYIKVIKPNGIYNSAIKALEAGNYDEAISAFSSLGEYKDAAARVGQAQADQLFANGSYSEALTVYNALDAAYRTHTADYEQMYTDAAKMLTEGDYDGATTAFQAISGYNDADTQAQESRYQKAAALNTAGKYDEAYTIYAALTGYKDVDSLIENDDNIAAAAWRAQFDAGNTVQFGHYEQDNNTSNGVEAIEWIVLANDGDTATLISKYALDARPYNTELKSVTWETCTLRKWLNGDFLNAAFSAEEQVRLETVTVTADKNPKYDTDPGNDTQDKVFLLSIDEVNRYFASDDARVCMPTKTAVANGAYTNAAGACWWWLRSPGINAKYPAFVNYDGSVNSKGNGVIIEIGVVRPVVALRLS